MLVTVHVMRQRIQHMCSRRGNPGPKSHKNCRNTSGYNIKYKGTFVIVRCERIGEGKEGRAEGCKGREGRNREGRKCSAKFVRISNEVFRHVILCWNP